jgi:hypothetical protein
MNGIYLTEQGKQAIKAKIAELEKQMDTHREFAFVFDALSGRNLMLKEILSSATILPVEESWRKCGIVNREDRESVNSDYPNGVIIQPKQ